jgi:hypothetical protein
MSPGDAPAGPRPMGSRDEAAFDDCKNEKVEGDLRRGSRFYGSLGRRVLQLLYEESFCPDLVESGARCLLSNLSELIRCCTVFF